MAEYPVQRHRLPARPTRIASRVGFGPSATAAMIIPGAQCGICTPGMIMAAVALGPKPTRDAMRVGLAGNLCRCTGSSAIYRSIDDASKSKITKNTKARKKT